MLINERTYFIHIPRTGGRYVSNVIRCNNYKAKHYLFREIYNNKQIPHLTYPEYEKFLGYIPEEKFSIIREPVDRFLSLIRKTPWVTNKNKNDIFNNKNSFFNFMNKMRLNINEETNWFKMQSDFLSKDVKLWRYEDKFEIDFKKWLENNFDIKLVVDLKFGLNEKSNEIILNKNQISWVKDYYYKDFKLLDY